MSLSSGPAPRWQAVVLWLFVAVAGAALMVFAFRAYLNPAALIDLANSRLC
jgi:hypothetical protein